MKLFIDILIIACLIQAALLFVAILNLLVQDYKISRWLKENRRDKWEELSMIGKLGPGFVNSMRAWSYIYSQENEADEYVGAKKRYFRKSAEAAKYTLLSFLLTAFALVFIAMLSR